MTDSAEEFEQHVAEAMEYVGAYDNSTVVRRRIVSEIGARGPTPAWYLAALYRRCQFLEREGERERGDDSRAPSGGEGQ